MHQSDRPIRKRPDPATVEPETLYEVNDSIPSDVLGSYTGKPLGHADKDEVPTQDADDL